MKMDWIHLDLYRALVAKHGDRVPSEVAIALRRGWYPLADRLFVDLRREYPDVRILSLRAYSGWLHIDHAEPAVMDILVRARLLKFLQGFVTQSLQTCEQCGSHRGQPWCADTLKLPSRRLPSRLDRVVCSECIPALEEWMREQCREDDARAIESYNCNPPEIVH